jgi:ferredoxin-NADP reductase
MTVASSAVLDDVVGSALNDAIEVRVDEIRYAARDTNFFVFRRPDGQRLPAFEPGAHIDVVLPNGLTRQYSLLHASKDPEAYTIGVKRDPRSTGGSAYLHDSLRVGALVGISHPRNNFPLHAGESHHTVLIAGGIGITPIWAMAERLAAGTAGWELHYSCRSRSDAVLLDTMSRIAEVRLNFDDENGGQFLDLQAIAANAPPDTHFYCCGPTPMLEAFQEAMADVPSDHWHVEYFTQKESAATEGGFVVRLRRSGLDVTVPPGNTILDTLREAGLAMPSSCEKGICGTCETTVLDGVPDHRDAILTESERAANDTMMICCSGAKSDQLVLDI